MLLKFFAFKTHVLILQFITGFCHTVDFLTDPHLNCLHMVSASIHVLGAMAVPTDPTPAIPAATIV
jgi:hypothetical protein